MTLQSFLLDCSTHQELVFDQGQFRLYSPRFLQKLLECLSLASVWSQDLNKCQKTRCVTLIRIFSRIRRLLHVGYGTGTFTLCWGVSWVKWTNLCEFSQWNVCPIDFQRVRLLSPTDACRVIFCRGTYRSIDWRTRSFWIETFVKILQQVIQCLSRITRKVIGFKNTFLSYLLCFCDLTTF